MAEELTGQLATTAISSVGDMINGYFERKEEARQKQKDRKLQADVANQSANIQRQNLNQQMQMHKDNLGLTQANERVTNAQAYAQELQNSSMERMMSAYGGPNE